MKKTLLSYLRCPVCHNTDLALAATEEDSFGIKCGTLTCQGCGQVYGICDYVPDFLPEQDKNSRWRQAWSYKWQKVAKNIRYSEAGDHDFQIKMNHTGDFDRDFSGQVVLDVGCGSGQDTARLASKNAVVIGVDQSEGPYLGVAYNKDKSIFKAMHFVRADVFALPFRDNCFDLIFSNGVLHHTPDTHKAFCCLPRLLKSGGLLAVWVYDRTQYWRLFELFWRPVLSKCPRWFLSLLLHSINRPWRWIYQYRQFMMNTMNPWKTSSAMQHVFDVLSGGFLLYLLTDFHLHMAVREKNPFVRYHDAFDCYSPTFAWAHDEAELFDWFTQCGLDVKSISARRCGMIGIKRHQAVPGKTNKGTK